MSGSFSSNKGVGTATQQDLDDFAEMFHGGLTKEEQALVSEITGKAQQQEVKQNESKNKKL